MCDVCGCGITDDQQHQQHQQVPRYMRVPAAAATVAVLRSLLAENDRAASHNKMHFNRHGVLSVNLMSSPGAGKTALLEASIDALRDEFNIAVIVGDLETENDAQRIRAKGVPAIQIVTGSVCHLDAAMVHDALHRLPLDQVDILFIENVGNLVCPASFDLGQHHDVVLLSVTEGDDKPAKYPVMFRAADAMLITKADLLPHLDDFDPARAERFLRQIGNPAPVLSISSRKNINMDGWLAWLRSAHAAQRAATESTP